MELWVLLNCRLVEMHSQCNYEEAAAKGVLAEVKMHHNNSWLQPISRSIVRSLFTTWCLVSSIW